MGKKFIESFVEECYRQGLTEKQACIALNVTMQKEAAFVKSATGEYGDIEGLGRRMHKIELSGAGNPRDLGYSVSAPYGQMVEGDSARSIYDPSDWLPMLGNWLERQAGNVANFFIPGTYTPPKVQHDPYSSQQYLLDYTKNRRRDYDRARAAAVAKYDYLVKKYGRDDPRVKSFDVNKAMMDKMYAPIQQDYDSFNKRYESKRAILEKRLARAQSHLKRNPNAAAEIEALQGQLAILDDRHAKAKAKYDKRTADFHDMFGGADGSDPASSRHAVARTTFDAIARNQAQLREANAMLQHQNSGFFNRWLKPWNWAKSFESMDPKWQRKRTALMRQNIELNAALDDQDAMYEDLARRGHTREAAEEISRTRAGGSTYGARLEEEAEKARAAKAKKDQEAKALKASITGTKAMRDVQGIMNGTSQAKRDFAGAMMGDMARNIDPKLAPAKPKAAPAKAPVKAPAAKPAITQKSMQDMHNLVNGTTQAKRDFAGSIMGNTARATLGRREAAKLTSPASRPVAAPTKPAAKPAKKKTKKPNEDAFV